MSIYDLYATYATTSRNDVSRSMAVARLCSLFAFYFCFGQIRCNDCPTLVELNLSNNYPKTRQVDSSTLEVDWTHLWPDLNWIDCVQNVEILVDGVAVEKVRRPDQFLPHKT